MRRSIVRILSIVTLAAVASACGVEPTSRGPSLHISNGTALDVTLFVNDVQVGEDPPGGPAPVIKSAGLPSLPWTVEARSASGRVLTSMRVEQGQVWTTTRRTAAPRATGCWAGWISHAVD